MAVITGVGFILFCVMALGEDRKILAVTKWLALDRIGHWLTRQQIWQRQVIALIALLVGILFIWLGIAGWWGHCPRGV